jgi:hypothetical protein
MRLSRPPKPTRAPDRVWKIVDRTPPVRFLELNEESFTQAITTSPIVPLMALAAPRRPGLSCVRWRRIALQASVPFERPRC